MGSIFDTEPSWAFLFLRLGLAAAFFAHSAQQLGWLGAGSAGRTIGNWNEKYGIPLWLGAVGMFTEIFGSLAMLLGLLTRPFALGLAIFMAVAIWKAHWRHGFFLARQPGEGSGIEYCLMLFLMALACFIGGGGALSFDLLLGD